MDATPIDRTADLQTHVQPIAPTDTMAEAGRKVLLLDFIKMLEHEAGSRTGEDIEDVHDMRVSTRRMRSALRMFEPFYKSKPVRVFRAQLKKAADALGAVRDLDVLIEDLQSWEEKQGASLAASIALLDAARQNARKQLLRALDKNDYARFIKGFESFLTTPGAGSRNHDPAALSPIQVRHIVPALIYEQLGVVRAYDAAIEEGEAETLHALRIEFKRLRYLVHFFHEVMGSTANDFLKDLKAIQDHLGRMQDVQVATDRLEDLLPDLDDEGAAALTAYLEAINAEADELGEKFDAVWKRFNSSTVQKKLATALVAL
jgi:CHAD domain-containing protein